jgi:hypothetical protein
MLREYKLNVCLLAFLARGESVIISMPSATGVLQEVTSLSLPLTLLRRHGRHDFVKLLIIA